MGKVIQFQRGATEQPAEPVGKSIHSDRFDEYLAALASNAQTLSANKSAIEKDLRVVVSIMRSTENPELRARLLEQMREVHDRLLLASLDLLNAKRLIESTVPSN